MYGEPLVGYITEHDTVESITMRVAAMAGISPYEIRLAFLKTLDVVPSYLPRLSGEAQEDSNGSHNHRGSDPTAPIPYDPSSGSLWKYISDTYPDTILTVKERILKLDQLRNQHQQQQGHANVHPPPPPPPSTAQGTLPAYFPLTIGIERTTIATTATHTTGINRNTNK